MRRPTLALTLLLSTGCATAPSGPVSIAESYARALEDNRLEDAWALTAGGARDSADEAAFRRRYADERVRRERAAAVRAGAAVLEARAPSLRLERTEAGWRVVEARPADVPRATLGRFLDAVEARDWKEAWALLAAPLRARYTPERLAVDFQREPLSGERVRRARLALEGPVEVGAGEALFPLGGELAVRLVLEDGHYRVERLE